MGHLRVKARRSGARIVWQRGSSGKVSMTHGATVPVCVDAIEGTLLAEREHMSRQAPRQVIESIDGYAPVILVPSCYVASEVLTRRLTSESGGRTNRAAMITAVRKPLDTRAATGCHSPSWSPSLLGQFETRVMTIEF